MRRASAWLATLLASAAAAAPASGPPAQEGLRLIEALETAPLAVVGELGEPGALDTHGWRATLTVESALVGDAKPGDPVVIAWEELAAERTPRFAAGDRVLVALEPLASGSLWRARFPDVKEYVRVRAVAQRGLAFLRSPSLGSLEVLAHFLALPPGERAGPTGQAHLLALAADGERALAVSAAGRLATLRGDHLEPERAALALRALARGERDDELADALLAWVDRAQPDGLAAPLDAALAANAGAPAIFVRARGLLPGGVASDRLTVLLAAPSPAQRAAAAGAATPAQRDRLAQLARNDPAPEVRSAALRRLVRVEGPDSLETLLATFSDREPTLRAEAAQLVAGLGPAAVPRLREVALGWPDPAPRTAVVALGLVNSADASAVLRELADTHPDPTVRALAGVAIGRPLGHAD